MIRHIIDKSPRLKDCVKRFITSSKISFTAVERPDASGRGKIICDDAPIDALVRKLSQRDIYADEGVKLSFAGEYKEEDGQRKFACIFLEARDGTTVIRLGESEAGDFPPDQRNKMNTALASLQLH